MEQDLDSELYIQYMTSYIYILRYENMKTWFPISNNIFSSGQNLPEDVILYRNYTEIEWLYERLS